MSDGLTFNYRVTAIATEPVAHALGSRMLVKTKIMKPFLKVLSAFALAATISGCNPSTPESNSVGNGATSQSTSSEAKKIRVGYLANIVMPQPLVGIEEGEYAKKVSGVEFSGQDYPAGPAVLEALRSGVIDIAYTGPYPPMNAFLKNKDIVLLAGAAKGGTALMVLKSSSIKTVADLKGKVVGVNQLGSTVDAVVQYNLLQAGLKPGRDVRLIEVKPAEQASTLKGGQVAAVAAPAPWPSQIEKSGDGRALLDSKQILNNGDYLAGVAFTTKKFADANPQLIAKFVAAHKQITDELNKDRVSGDARVLAAWSKVTKKKLDPAVAKAAFATITFTSEAKLENFERDMDVSAQVGFLKKKGSLDGFLWSTPATP